MTWTWTGDDGQSFISPLCLGRTQFFFSFLGYWDMADSTQVWVWRVIPEENLSEAFYD